MEKISGILPATPRTRSVDISSAPPARAGAPTIGRSSQMAISAIPAIEDRLSLSPEFEAFQKTGAVPALDKEVGYKNMEEAKKLKVIEDINKKFFETKNETPTTTEKANGEVIW